MRKNIMFAAVCLAAFVLAASGCQENPGHSETFSSTVPAFSMWDTEKSAETLNTTTSVSEAKPAADTAEFTTTVINGEEFDSSYKRGEPAKFRPTGVIKGWTEALTMMPAGSKWEIYVPYRLGYGEQQRGSIPAYSTLIFTIELLQVVKEAAQ